jgi:hypothetical protein
MSQNSGAHYAPYERIRLDSDSDSAMIDQQADSDTLPEAFQSDHALVQSLLASDKNLAEIYVNYLIKPCMHTSWLTFKDPSTLAGRDCAAESSSP